jgi:hypothetical protein
MLGTASTAVVAGIVCGPVGTRVPWNAAEYGSTRIEATRRVAGADVQAMAAGFVSVQVNFIAGHLPLVSSRAGTRR